MDEQDYTKQAKEVIQKILYITIATASKEGIPWNTPVYCGVDDTYHFFFISAHQSRHATNIRENNKIALVIYDSTVPAGTGFGVYMEATAYELTNEAEVTYGLQHVFGRIGHAPHPANDCLGESPLRVYKAVPNRFWVNIAEDYKGQYVDKRVEVKFSPK